MNQYPSFSTQLWHFVLHLRLHYQFFILSGGYLFSALFLDQIEWRSFWLQFLNVHVLLFGGATAYNSFWDKDEGPIGGLKSPPKMTSWMWTISLVIQYIGIIFALFVGLKFAAIYVCSMILFWLYSTPLARWKGSPILSLYVIGISTGTNSFFMGFLAGGGDILSRNEAVTAIGVALVLLSLYPVSQIFQIDEDKKRGDVTFAIKFGFKMVKVFFVIMFLSGTFILSLFLYLEDKILGLIFGGTGLVSFIGISYILFNLTGKKEEYKKVMMIKFLASLGFVLFILSVLLIKTIV